MILRIGRRGRNGDDKDGERPLPDGNGQADDPH